MASDREAKQGCKPAVSPFLSLPSDVMCGIGLLLDLQERLELGRVCKQLHALVKESSSLWRDLSFKNANAVNPRNSLSHSVQRLAFVRQHINAIRTIDIGAYVGEHTPSLVSLLAVLSGATALRNLRVLADTGPESFAHCGQIHQLTALEVGPISGLSHAEQLSECLWGLTRLQSLRLRFELAGYSDGFHAVPPALSRLSALTHLSFGEQRPASLSLRAPYFVFRELPAELFLGLRRLRCLQIFNCGVTSLPADVSLLTGLQSLSILSSTALQSPQLQLPAEISHCTALTSLQLSCAAIPQPMWRLPLRELTLDQTPIAIDQSQQFSRLAALRSLRLCNRQPQSPADFGLYRPVNHLRVGAYLTCLRLDGNNLTDFPAFPAIGQLQDLDLKRNRLSAAVGLPLLRLTNVRTLDLSFNEGLTLSDAVNHIDVARMFAVMPELCTVGLRKRPESHWGAADLQTIADVHHVCGKYGRSAPKLICHRQQVGSRPEDVCELDRDTYFLDQVVNSP